MLNHRATACTSSGVYRLFAVLTLLGLVACAAGQDPQANGTDARVPAQISALSAARDALRSRIDIAHSAIDLRVEASEIPPQRALDIGVFMTALAELASLEPAPDSVWTGDGFSHFVIGTQTARLVPGTRYVDVHDSRGYAAETARDPSDEELTTVGTRVMDALGIDPREGRAEVVSLGSESADASAATGTRVERVGRKVFFFRTLGGVPVAGARMVFSFAPDGSLRHIRGWWPVLDLAHSQTVSALSDAEVVERALDALIAGNAQTDSNVPITLETFLAVDEGESISTVRLRAAARTNGVDPEGNLTRGIRYEFDI